MSLTCWWTWWQTCLQLAICNESVGIGSGSRLGNLTTALLEVSVNIYLLCNVNIIGVFIRFQLGIIVWQVYVSLHASSISWKKDLPQNKFLF